MERVVHVYDREPLVRRTVPVPSPLAEDLGREDRDGPSRVHLCRLDLLPTPDGGFHLMETNANCPGGLVTCGIAARRWRGHLTDRGLRLPPPLPQEAEGWMASWLVGAARRETGRSPKLVALVREEGGNRLELPGLGADLARLGIAVREVDPRSLAADEHGRLELDGVPVGHGYLKLGLQELMRMRTSVVPLVSALRSGAFFVQNGWRARLIGDNKLILAVLSDPGYEHLFDPDDLELIRPHVPWSRNLALCGREVLERVRRNPAGYVLKRPLDTRGRGVVVGLEAAPRGEWEAAVRLARKKGWLVQRYHAATFTESRFGSGLNHHDLCIGVADGRVVSAHMRSSPALRMNVARRGRLHPAFIEIRPVGLEKRGSS